MLLGLLRAAMGATAVAAGAVGLGGWLCQGHWGWPLGGAGLLGWLAWDLWRHRRLAVFEQDGRIAIANDGWLRTFARAEIVALRRHARRGQPGIGDLVELFADGEDDGGDAEEWWTLLLADDQRVELHIDSAWFAWAFRRDLRCLRPGLADREIARDI
jgi:hypothetical protein